jgi:Tfp pilus assembly protein PilV
MKKRPLAKYLIKNRPGFTLIEFIMIIVITGIAIVPITSMILQGVKGSVDSDVASKTHALAQWKMEETKQLSFSSISASSGTFSAPFTDYNYTVNVGYVDGNFNTTGSSLYKKVDITVQCVSGYSLTLTTVISDHN